MQFFAIIPAAGLSIRMGCDKLLLPWGEATLIEATLAAWKKSRVDRIVVTVRSDQTALAAICEKAGAQVALAASPPPDMKASVLIALDFVRERYAPTSEDAWLLAPADMPRLSMAAIDALCAAHAKRIAAREEPRVNVPTAAGRRGHPVLFPWRLAEEVKRLGPDEGMNVLMEAYRAESIGIDSLVADEASFADVDTRHDYDRLNAIPSSRPRRL